MHPVPTINNNITKFIISSRGEGCVEPEGCTRRLPRRQSGVTSVALSWLTSTQRVILSCRHHCQQGAHAVPAALAAL